MQFFQFDLFFNPLFFTLFVFFFTLSSMVTGVRNLIRILLSIEVMLLCLTFIFVVLSVLLNNMVGQVFAIFILAIAACESALGLSLLIMFFRNRGMLTSFELLSSLKG
jgi:NADH-quinone oxidoreductase subunit K